MSPEPQRWCSVWRRLCWRRWPRFALALGQGSLRLLAAPAMLGGLLTAGFAAPAVAQLLAGAGLALAVAAQIAGVVAVAVLLAAGMQRYWSGWALPARLAG